MSGYTARLGFEFQDNYLLLRILKAASESLNSVWRVGLASVPSQTFDFSQFKFGIEAPLPSVANPDGEQIGLDWDVLVRGEFQFEFAEVKSSVVSREERLTFWKRLRKELLRKDQDNIPLVPILVVDPNNSDKLDKWEELASAAASYSGVLQPSEPSGNVLTVDHLLAEALWWICRPDKAANKSDPTIDTHKGLEALKRFELHCHDARKIGEQVEQFVELLFPDGFTETHALLLKGWIGKRSVEAVRRLFSINEILQEVGILRDAISLSPGTLKKWRILWNEASAGVKARTRLSVGKSGEKISAERAQPNAIAAINNNVAASIIILGQGGAGKSALISQSANEAKRHNDDVLYCGANDLIEEEVEELIKATRFNAALMALREPERRIQLCIDGLDEAPPNLRKRWGQLLLRVCSLSNVRALISIRDSIWQNDGDLRSLLKSWYIISLELWPQEVVRDLLSKTELKELLPPAVVELLRIPIMMDLFWQTFVEDGQSNSTRIRDLQTRHNLLAAFWFTRLLDSPRHPGSTDIRLRLNVILSSSASYIGGFPEAGLDARGVEVLLSEGVLVREGRLKPRLQFRHPLLRDFAFAQWCLETDLPAEVAYRLNSIAGGLQRNGALRAIFEALSDPDASIDYPHLTPGNVVRELVKPKSASASQVAQVLGSRPAEKPLNPADWPLAVQSLLPSEFARDILLAARLEKNCSWAPCLKEWPNDATWMGENYPTEVWEYAKLLSDEAKADLGDLETQKNLRQVAEKLRLISEHPRFYEEFASSERWLKMQTILCVIPALPEAETIEWLEREMAQSSSRTRSFSLEQLIHLAKVDAARTAKLYREAVGLTEVNGRPAIDKERWGGNMDHQAIEWSLAGADGKRSLLKEYPVTFLPVASDLTEALWTSKERNQDEFEEENQQILKDGTNGLIDDYSRWLFWSDIMSTEPYDRCLKAIEQCVKSLFDRGRELSDDIWRGLRLSRMASIQMILFDAVLEKREHPSSADRLRELVIDSRLYWINGFEFWIEQALLESWPHLNESQRNVICEVLRQLLTSDGFECSAKGFLARIPRDELPDDLQSFRPDDEDRDFSEARRPFGATVEENDGSFGLISSSEIEFEIGEWPDEFDIQAIREFASYSNTISDDRVDKAVRGNNAAKASEKAEALFPILLTRLDLLEDSSRFWIWRNLSIVMSHFRRYSETVSNQPQFSFVLNSAILALERLKDVPSNLPGKLPERDIWVGHRESAWGLALRLADEALTWPPAADDADLQDRFMGAIETAYSRNNPLLELTCSHGLRAWHWSRSPDRREKFYELVWVKQKDPTVLSWSFSGLGNFPDTDRLRIARHLLGRNDLPSANQLAHRLGQFVGAHSMAVYQNGQRSELANLAREVVDSAGNFAFLDSRANRIEFLKSLMFGMKQQIKLGPLHHLQSASDFGEWALKIWKALLPIRGKRTDSEGVILFAIYWLGNTGELGDRVTLRKWWQKIEPLLEDVVTTGGRPDCFTLFFQLRGAEFNDLGIPENRLKLIHLLINRIRTGVISGTMNVSERLPDKDDFHSWREISDYAAESIDVLREDGMLMTDHLREDAHQLLSALAAEPIHSPRARTALHRLRND